MPQTEILSIFGEDSDKVDVFFTDGSKMSGKNREGYAIFRIINKTLIQRRSNTNMSIFSAEAMAIVETLKVIEKDPSRKNR